jgi:hypothetical protein
MLIKYLSIIVVILLILLCIKIVRNFNKKLFQVSKCQHFTNDCKCAIECIEHRDCCCLFCDERLHCEHICSLVVDKNVKVESKRR